MPIHLPRKVVPLGSAKLLLADVKTIYDKLWAQVGEERDREVAGIKKLDNQSDEDFDNYKTRAANQAFKITLIISGRSGESLFGDDITIFESSNRPDKITQIYLTNITSYQNFAGMPPLNAFELNLDFSKPPLLDANNPVSAPTRNASSVTVQGDRDSWVAAITDAVLSVIQTRRTHRTWLHRAFVYDLGMFLFALPFAFFVCWRTGPFISKYLQPLSYVVSAAAYGYLILLTLFGYRVLFGYTKWAFPALELSDNRDASAQHRAIWAAIILGLITDFVWTVLYH